MPVARFRLLCGRRLEQDDIAIEQPGEAADQPIAEPQDDQAHPREPGDRQHQPGKPQHLGHPAVLRQDFQGARLTGRRRAHLGQVDLVRDEPERNRGEQVDHQVVEEVGHPIRRQAEPESEIEEEDRANGQVGPGEEPVLGGRERMCALEEELGGDEADQYRDQDQHGVFEDGHRAASEDRDQAEVQQSLLPLAMDPARQTLDPTSLATEERGRRAGFGAIDRRGGFARVLHRAGGVEARAVVGERADLALGRLWRIGERLEAGVASGLAGPSPARFGEAFQVLLGKLQPSDGTTGRHLPEEGRHLADLVEGGLDDRGTGVAAAGGRQHRHPIVGRAGELDASPAQGFQPIVGLLGTVRRAWADFGLQVQRGDLRLESREVKPLHPERLGAGAEQRPGQLATDPTLQQPGLHLLTMATARLVARIGMPAVRRAQ